MPFNPNQQQSRNRNLRETQIQSLSNQISSNPRTRIRDIVPPALENDVLSNLRSRGHDMTTITGLNSPERSATPSRNNSRQSSPVMSRLPSATNSLRANSPRPAITPIQINQSPVASPLITVQNSRLITPRLTPTQSPAGSRALSRNSSVESVQSLYDNNTGVNPAQRNNQIQAIRQTRNNFNRFIDSRMPTSPGNMSKIEPRFRPQMQNFRRTPRI